MGQKSSLYRTIEILKSLNDGKRLCISHLSLEYEVSERTIRRDFELIRELFGDFMSKDGECYMAYEKVLLEDILSATDLMTLANIVNIFDITNSDSIVSDKTKALIAKSTALYDFKSRPFENMKNRDILKKLEHAIKFKKEIKLAYQTERTKTHRTFHPYKILFLNENFYLVGDNVSKSQFEFLSISMVVEVSYTTKSFFTHKDTVEFIEKIQTPWAVYGKEDIIVRVRVDKRIRRFFILKEYLPSQKIISYFDNGDLEVEYSVTNLRELEELIVKWLPSIRIIRPRHLKKMIKKSLEKKLRGLCSVDFS